MRDVVIVDSVRTGLTKAFRGSFNLTRSDDLLAHCIDSLLDRNPQYPKLITPCSPQTPAGRSTPSCAASS